jgi:hypothetical protein
MPMRALLRALGATLGAVGLASLVAGCGSTGGSAAGSQRAITNTPSPRVEAYADAVNLRAADLPGMAAVSHAGRIANGVPLGAAIDRCTGRVGRSGQAVAPLTSAFFSEPANRRSIADPSGVKPAMSGDRVYSVIDVMRTEALALRDVTALGAGGTRTCLKEHYEGHEGIVDSEQRYSHVEVSPLSASLAGLPAVGLRVQGTFAAGSGSRRRVEPFAADFIAMVSGRSVIELRAVGMPRAFAVAGERRLVALLLQRAKRHSPD